MTMDLQQIFDKVATHLLTQNRRSRHTEHGDTYCAYRGKRGAMCAVGALITDEAYDPSFDEDGGLRVHSEEILKALEQSGVLAPQETESRARPIMLLRSLQLVHDDNKPSQWKGALRALGKEFALNVKVLEGF